MATFASGSTWGVSNINLIYGYNAVTSIASIPITDRFVKVTISASATFSLASIPPAGNEIHIIVYNSGSSAITLTIPTTGNYVSILNVSSITLPATSYTEISAISDGSKIYLRTL